MEALSQPDVLFPYHVKHEEGWGPPNDIRPSRDLCQRILIYSLDNYEFGESTIDLDSHANMCVCVWQELHYHIDN